MFLSEHVRPICFFTWGTRVLFNVSINIAQVYLGNTILKKQGRVSRVWIKTQVPCSEIIKIVSTCHIFWTSFFLSSKLMRQRFIVTVRSIRPSNAGVNPLVEMLGAIPLNKWVYSHSYRGCMGQITTVSMSPTALQGLTPSINGRMAWPWETSLLVHQIARVPPSP